MRPKIPIQNAVGDTMQVVHKKKLTYKHACVNNKHNVFLTMYNKLYI